MMAKLSDLPLLEFELALEVFTHRSLIWEGMKHHPQHGDNGRLAELGSRVLDLEVTATLFRGQQQASLLLSADEIVVCSG